MGQDFVEAPRIYPAFRYLDAGGAIEFLCRAFGFSIRAKYMKRDKVAHAELAFGSSMIMLGSVDDARPGFAGLPTGDFAGKSTYIAVDNVDEFFARAKAAGAKILEPPTNGIMAAGSSSAPTPRETSGHSEPTGRRRMRGQRTSIRLLGEIRAPRIGCECSRAR